MNFQCFNFQLIIVKLVIDCQPKADQPMRRKNRYLIIENYYNISMNYPFQYSNQHHAQACALFCMDFRFKDETLKYLKEELNLKDLDIITAAGASKNIADPKVLTDYQFVTRQIEISIQLHEIDKIILINHANCGAYGSREFFGGADKEKAVHAKDLLKSKKLLEKRFAEQEIVLIYANLINEAIVFEKIKNNYPQVSLK